MSNMRVMYRLIKLIKPLVIPMIFAIIMGVLGFICAIGIPVLSVMALLQVAGMYNHFDLSLIMFILLTCAILRGVLHYIEQACNHYIAFKLLAVIRDHVYTALRRLAPSKLDGKDKGNLISLITNDIELLEVFYAHTISPVIIAFITSLIMLKFFAHVHIGAMIVALLGYITTGIIIPVYIHGKGKDVGNQYRDKVGSFSSYILESFRNMSTILQYQMGDYTKGKILNKSNDLENSQETMKSIESLQIVISQSTITLFAVIMFITLSLLNVSGFRIIMGTVLMLSSFAPVLALSSLANHLITTLSSGRRVLDLLDEQEIVSEVKNQEEKVFGDILVENVGFAYDDETILNDVHLSFMQNQTTGIIGKSGSGKSTLLKLIMRFYDPKEGRITIAHNDLKTINTSQMRQFFAYVTQETVLFHDSIYNNIKIARLNASKEEVIEACQKASIHEFIVSLPQGYETNVAELGSSLSGGEKQRIALARAFLSHAPCILLDEPTSNLDVINEGIILRSLQNQKEKTIIIVSHRPSTMKIASTVISMNQGRVS
ncbi:MAG: ABC transporter ATP-binding protein [Coprobacillus sp.]